jgi:hypothetical protein
MTKVREHLRRHRGGLHISPALLGAKDLTAEEQQLYERRTLRKPWLHRLGRALRKPRPGFYVFRFDAFKNGDVRSFVRVGATQRASVAKRLLDHRKRFGDWLDTTQSPSDQRTAREGVLRSFRLLFFWTRFPAGDRADQRTVDAFAMESCARDTMTGGRDGLDRWFARLAGHKDLFYILPHVRARCDGIRKALRALGRACGVLYARTEQDLHRQAEVRRTRADIDERKRELYRLTKAARSVR